MRLLRASLLLLLLAAATGFLMDAARHPLLGGWRAIGVGGSAPAGAPAAELAALLTGGCALLLVLTWVWLVGAVGACTWEALRVGSADSSAHTSTFLRPPLVRAVVATCLGVSALAAPAAHAESPVGRVQAVPDDLRPTAVAASAAALHLLDGLPVPDRATGRRPGHAASSAHRRQPSPSRRGLQVAPGDSLWSLTAGLLPPDTSPGTVAAGCRLLYAANRGVVGPDPDLLQPGQTLRIDPALEALTRAARRNDPVQPLDHQPLDHQPLDHHAGGAR